MSQQMETPHYPEQLLLLCGPPACGKSTWADLHIRKNPNTVVIGRDRIRARLFPAEYLLGEPEDDKELEVSRTEFADTLQAIRAGKQVIIDNTNVTGASVGPWEQFALIQNVTMRLVMMDVPPLDVLQERNQNRDRTIPPEAVERLYLAWEQMMAVADR